MARKVTGAPTRGSLGRDASAVAQNNPRKEVRRRYGQYASETIAHSSSCLYRYQKPSFIDPRQLRLRSDEVVGMTLEPAVDDLG